MLLAALTAIVTVLACWLAWARVRDAMVGEFDTRLIRVAHTAASQISPQTVEDARVAGEDGGGYLAVQVQLVTLRGATGLAEASLIDTTRATLVDARAPEDTERSPSALDTLAAQSLGLALRGRATISPPYVHGGVRLRAALAPHTADATVIIVAQRVSTIIHADQILVLEDGESVGLGTHAELLQTCETYREIVESQMTAEEAA